MQNTNGKTMDWPPMICLSLLLAGTMLAVTAQYVVAVLAVIALVPYVAEFGLKSTRWRLLWPHVLFVVGYMGAFTLSTYLNGGENFHYIHRFLRGYLFFLFIPIIVTLAGFPITVELKKNLTNVVVILAFISLCMALAQRLWGFDFRHWEVIDYFRAKGFYSHALTLAFNATLPVPFASHLFFRNWRSPRYGLLLGSLLGIIWCTMSRAALLVALFFVVVNAVYVLKGQQRMRALMAMGVLLIGFAAVDGSFRDRFATTFTKNPKKFGEYSNIRLAVWDANIRHYLEKPIFGHGLTERNQQELDKQYERLGLVGKMKAFEAHDTFLQMLTDAGLPALLCFLGLVAYYFSLAYRLNQTSPMGMVFMQSIVCFLLAGLTQNVFQDAEVRYLGMVGVVFLLSSSSGK